MLLTSKTNSVPSVGNVWRAPSEVLSKEVGLNRNYRCIENEYRTKASMEIMDCLAVPNFAWKKQWLSFEASVFLWTETVSMEHFGIDQILGP